MLIHDLKTDNMEAHRLCCEKNLYLTLVLALIFYANSDCLLSLFKPISQMRRMIIKTFLVGRFSFFSFCCFKNT